jgi:hypothetical protein
MEYRGKCFCGAVEIAVSGAPAAAGYCHCQSCRHWSAGPINAFTLWPPDAVKVTKGKENLGTFHKSENSLRRWCKSCGGHVLTEHPQWNLVDVYAAVLENFHFEPHLHVNYAETVLPMRDGLPKQADLPKEMGGTGTLVSE